jgi:cytochrome c-type biogenesis protein
MQVSLIVAFLGGTLSVLPACGPTLLPAFFAYSFKEKHRLFLSTLVFALGFGLIFVPFALGVRIVADFLISSRAELFQIAGIILIVFGIFSILGKSVSPKAPRWKFANPWLNVFLLGLTLGVTATACSAPIFGAIVTLTALPDKNLESLILSLAFLAGMVAPLLVLALLADKLNIFSWGVLQWRILKIQAFSRTFEVHVANLIAGIAFIALGLFFAFYQQLPAEEYAQSSGLVEWFLKANQRLLGQ